MTMSVSGTGPYNVSGMAESVPYATFPYFSGEITISDSFEDNLLDFGKGLSEVWIINKASGAIAFQFKEHFVENSIVAANVADGIVLQDDKIFFKRLNKRQMKIRSAVDGVTGFAYVFGV
jgi:hypothetical protein